MPEAVEQRINSVWSGSAGYEMLTLPSGQIVRARKMSVEDILATGILSESDALTSFVLKEHVQRARTELKGHLKKEPRDADDVDVAALMRDTTTVREAVYLIDRVTAMVVLEPEVRLHIEKTPTGTRRIPPEERELDVIYTDLIGMADKSYLFEWAMDGGIPDPNTFRSPEQSSTPVESLGDGKAVLLPPRSARRTRQRRDRRR